jgi:3-methyladenine DNA glycosylase AlkD
MSLQELRKSVKNSANKEKGIFLQGFFKTGPGEYAEGDIFAGLTVPQSRKIVKANSNLSLKDMQELIESKIHEERLIALLLLVAQYSKGNEKERERIFKFYLKNIKHVNNWDLVDLSAPKIIGRHLVDKDKALLFDLAESNNLWKRRIAILSTQYFIREGFLDYTYQIADKLLNDKEDLIHKAVGWMLRETGKIDRETEEEFLKTRYKKMPRTMLRYSIEKFPEKERKRYLNGLV